MFVFISTMALVPWGGSETLWHGAAKRLLTRGVAVQTQTALWSCVPAPSRRPCDQRYYRHSPGLMCSICVADSEAALFCRLSSQVGESYETLDFFDAFAESSHLVREFAG